MASSIFVCLIFVFDRPLLINFPNCFSHCESFCLRFLVDRWTCRHPAPVLRPTMPSLVSVQIALLLSISTRLLGVLLWTRCAIANWPSSATIHHLLQPRETSLPQGSSQPHRLRPPLHSIESDLQSTPLGARQAHNGPAFLIVSLPPSRKTHAVASPNLHADRSPTPPKNRFSSFAADRIVSALDRAFAQLTDPFDAQFAAQITAFSEMLEKFEERRREQASCMTTRDINDLPTVAVRSSLTFYNVLRPNVTNRHESSSLSASSTSYLVTLNMPTRLPLRFS